MATSFCGMQNMMSCGGGTAGEVLALHTAVAAYTS